MVWTTDITSVLNQWNQMGVFSYVLPFLLIFSVVFAILSKTKIFEDNRAVNAVISLAIGLLSLQFDFVSTFFATIFPRFGVGLAVLLVAIILIGIFYPGDEYKTLKWVGYVVGIGVIIWAIANWGFWNDDLGISWFIQENFWALIILGAVITAIVLVAKGGSTKSKKAEE